MLLRLGIEYTHYGYLDPQSRGAVGSPDASKAREGTHRTEVEETEPVRHLAEI